MNQRIKILKELLNESRVFKSIKKYNYSPKYPEELEQILKLKNEQKDPDLNDVDVSNLYSLVEFGKFDFFSSNNFYVDEWDVSNIKFFNLTFKKCFHFNSDLSNWNTSNGILFDRMFSDTMDFNQKILNFDLRNSESVEGFLNYASSFNQEIYSFKFGRKVESLKDFFSLCKSFNKDVSMWDVSNIKNFTKMFKFAENFKQDLTSWDVSSARWWDEIFNYSKMEEYPELMPEKFRIDYLKNKYEQFFKK